MQKKKWLSLLLAAMLMCSLTACASSEDVVQLASEVEEATSEETEDTTSEVASADEKEDTSKEEETKTETPDKSDTGTNSAKDLLAKGETNTSDTKEDASTSAKDVTKTTEKAKETISTDTKNKENNVVTEKNTQTTTTTTKTEETKPIENTTTNTTQPTTNTTTPKTETPSVTPTTPTTPSNNTSTSSSSSSSNTTTNKYCAENGHYYNQSEGEWKERIENLSGGCYRVWRYRNLMCGECGNILPDADEEVVEEVHTKIVTMEGKKATCTEDGYSEGISCGCGYYSQAGGTVLPATGHNYGPVRRTGNILSYNEETGEVVLETAQTCGRCGDKIYGEEIDYQQ